MEKEEIKVGEKLVQSSPVKDSGDTCSTLYASFTASQWLRCAIGLHRRNILDQLVVTDSHNCGVGINIITRCECCGKIFNKFIITKDIR
jgi:hypothetical protein|nr:MAG TPA: zinc-ribbon domain protein [Crassvirales sp.]